jgi:hypothetical protein
MEGILRAVRCLWLCLGKRPSGRTWSTILTSPFLDSCRRFGFSELSGIFASSIFHFYDFDFPIFRFFEKNFFGANDRAERYGDQYLYIATLDAGSCMVYMVCPRSIEGQRH